MKHYFNQFTKLCFLVLALLCSFGLKAQETDNVFNLDAQLMTRGELRAGGFKADSLDSERVSHFALGRYRIIADYQRSWLVAILMKFIAYQQSSLRDNPFHRK